MNTTPFETSGRGPHFTTLAEFEAWAVEDWLYIQGTDEAQLHVRGKLEEEAHEAAVELSSGDPNRIVDELGDFLWTAHANGSNVGITLEESLRHELRPNLLAEGPIVIAQIDVLALDLIPEESVEVMATWLTYLSHYLGKAAKQWHTLGSLVPDTEHTHSFSQDLILSKRNRVYDGLTQALLVTSAIAQRFAGKRLGDVMDHNREKLKQRPLDGHPITKPPKN